MANPIDSIDLSHHAYAVIGSDAERDQVVADLSKKHKIKIAGNPDFFDRRYEVFSIDDAREIKSLAETRPMTSNGKKIFVLLANGITVEAQNALLKLFEEPGEYARFFLIIPSSHLLIATIKSRVNIIGTTSKSASDSEVAMAAKAFVSAPIAKRLDMVKALMDDITKEKKTKQDAIDLLNALEESLHHSGAKKNAKALESVLLAERYATDRAPSMKMLLEYVALNL